MAPNVFGAVYYSELLVENQLSMTARMSSPLKILYSLPSSLISVPPYFVTSTRSPFLKSNGTFFPLSSVLPLPRATTRLSMGFSLAVSGIRIPPFLTSCSSTASTRMRSPMGLTFSVIICFFCFAFLLHVQWTPAALAREKSRFVLPPTWLVKREAIAGAERAENDSNYCYNIWRANLAARVNPMRLKQIRIVRACPAARESSRIVKSQRENSKQAQELACRPLLETLRSGSWWPARAATKASGSQQFSET